TSTAPGASTNPQPGRCARRRKDRSVPGQHVARGVEEHWHRAAAHAFHCGTAGHGVPGAGVVVVAREGVRGRGAEQVSGRGELLAGARGDLEGPRVLPVPVDVAVGFEGNDGSVQVDRDPARGEAHARRTRVAVDVPELLAGRYLLGVPADVPIARAGGHAI